VPGTNVQTERTESSAVAFSQHAGSVLAPIVVSEIADGCLYSGFFGRLDSARMKQVTDHMLASVERSSSERIIIDLANVDMIDSMVAGHLLKLGSTLRLIGVEPVYCGISTLVAQTMAKTGVEFGDIVVVRNLKAALRYVLALDGVEL